MQLKKAASARGLKPVAAEAEAVMAENAAYWREGRVLRFALPVPLIAADGKMLKTYRLEDRPTTVPDEEGLQIEFSSEHRYILVSNDR